VAAREDYAQRNVAVRYIDVKKDKGILKEMLKFSNGVREVPVIVEDGKVTIGFGGT
jgi:glutaredoxin 3